MNKIVRFALSLFVLALAGAQLAQAQATRTWVSGVGDDANPCSRTAPCKTFAGAISKTAPSGEINVLDPGGFGAVTITKSITISSEGFEAGVLVSGTNGIVVSASPTDVVVLRGLDIEGLGTGLAGIKVLAAGVVNIENCIIDNFVQKGVDFEPTSATPGSVSQIHVRNSIIRRNNGTLSGGILIKPGTNVSATGTIDHTQILNNFFGVRVEDNSKIAAKDSTAAGNASAGFLAVSNSTAVALNLDQCVVANNVNGVKADNANATLRISNCAISGNTTGIFPNGGHIVSFGNNNNADPGTPNGPNIMQQ